MTGMRLSGAGEFIAPRTVYHLPLSVALCAHGIGRMICNDSSGRSKRVGSTPPPHVGRAEPGQLIHHGDGVGSPVISLDGLPSDGVKKPHSQPGD